MRVLLAASLVLMVLTPGCAQEAAKTTRPFDLLFAPADMPPGFRLATPEEARMTTNPTEMGRAEIAVAFRAANVTLPTSLATQVLRYENASWHIGILAMVWSDEAATDTADPRVPDRWSDIGCSGAAWLRSGASMIAVVTEVQSVGGYRDILVAALRAAHPTFRDACAT